MKIGYYVQGDVDEAIVHGLAERWCPDAQLAEARFRGSSGTSFRREIQKSLWDLKDEKACDVLVVLTDSDVNRWRDVKNRESAKVPQDCKHLTVFGVADRNAECWLAIDKHALATALGCRVEDIPDGDPSEFVKRSFGLNDRDTRERGKTRVREYVVQAPLKAWIEDSESFGDFYGEVRRLALSTECQFPNELES